MEQAVIDILRAAFPGMEVTLEALPGGRLSGRVVWEGFSELDQVDRQNRIWEELRRKLGAEARQVGVLLTYTPDEMNAMSAA
ncbi:MAG: hypothetical protein IT210_02170 [Armatimonadetes bacterium]|nr:hypothetical protein [Armatimonadota bacterium]